MNDTFVQKLKHAISGKRGLPFFFMLAALLCSIGMLTLYSLTGITTFTPVLSGKVLTLLWISIVLEVLFSICEIKLCKYAVYLVALWTWMEYIASEMSYISNVFVGIDGNSFGTAFILTNILGILAVILSLISAISQKQEIGTSDLSLQKGAGHE